MDIVIEAAVEAAGELLSAGIDAVVDYLVYLRMRTYYLKKP